MTSRWLLWCISISLMMLAVSLSAISYVPPGPGVVIELVLPNLLFIGAILSGAVALGLKTPPSALKTGRLPIWTSPRMVGAQ